MMLPTCGWNSSLSHSFPLPQPDASQQTCCPLCHSPLPLYPCVPQIGASWHHFVLFVWVWHEKLTQHVDSDNGESCEHAFQGLSNGGASPLTRPIHFLQRFTIGAATCGKQCVGSMRYFDWNFVVWYTDAIDWLVVSNEWAPRDGALGGFGWVLELITNWGTLHFDGSQFVAKGPNWVTAIRFVCWPALEGVEHFTPSSSAKLVVHIFVMFFKLSFYWSIKIRIQRCKLIKQELISFLFD